MSVSLLTTLVDCRAIPEQSRHSGYAGLQFTVITLGATLVLTAALSSIWLTSAVAGGGLQDSPKARAPDSSISIAAIRWTLKNQHDQMVKLASKTFGSVPSLEDLKDQRLTQSMTTSSAEANFENAKLTREVAEIGVTEYVEGIFRQDKASLEGEIILARADLDRARDAVEGTKLRLAQIKKASKGSTSDLAHEFGFEDAVANANRRLPRAEMTLKKAESKLKNLVEYTKPKRLKELQSEVEKLKADELSKKAIWELEQSKLNSLKEAIKTRGLSATERTSGELLARAIAVEGQIQTKLEEVGKNGNADEPLRKEIQGLTDQLQAVIEQAEVERSAAQFARLKTRIHAAASR